MYNFNFFIIPPVSFIKETKLKSKLDSPLPDNQDKEVKSRMYTFQLYLTIDLVGR